MAKIMSSNQKMSDFAKLLSEELKKKKDQNRIEDISKKLPVVEQQVDPLVPLDQNFVTFREMNDHYSLFLSRIQQQLASLGGGGEVNFRFLDDVNRDTMGSSNDNHVLEYDAATGKVQFTDIVGPIEQLSFNTSHTHQEERVPGTLCWDPGDQTLNLTHPGDVTQQIGQELYAKVRNGTANTIFKGTAVQFIGADENGGQARLLVGPMLADGTYPSLYILGITSQDIEPDEDGRVNVWGKVRNIDTSAFDVGNILYVSANTAGGLTNVKPTTPNNVIPVAAVLRKDATEGELFVRPTIEQQMYFGRFSRLTDQVAGAINTAIAIQFDTVEISNGITFNGGSNTEILVSDSGFYQFDLSAQVSAASNKGVVYFWFRKNGTDISHSTRSTTVTNGDTFNISTTIVISLDIDDYVEVMWAKSASSIFLDAKAATAFAPETASVMLNVTQVQL
jgi:hypothetical protein